MNHDDLPTFDPSDRLPVAVYGTLRPGHGNADLWTGRATVVADRATLDGYRLVTHGWFPYALPAEGEQTVVTLIQPYHYAYDSVLRRLDALEGVPSHYERRAVAVETSRGEWFAAWLYVPADPDDYADLDPVPGNEWTHDAYRRRVTR